MLDYMSLTDLGVVYPSGCVFTCESDSTVLSSCACVLRCIPLTASGRQLIISQAISVNLVVPSL